MTGLDQLLSADVVYRLGWTLLHSLWQGALMAGVLALLLFIIPNTKPNGRYVAGCLSLLMILVLCGVTFVTLDTPCSTIEPASIAGSEPERSIDVPLPDEPPTRFALPGTVVPPSDVASPMVTQTEPGVETLPNKLPSPKVASKPWSNGVTGFVQLLLPRLTVIWLLGVFALSIWHLGGWIALYRLQRIGTSPVASEITALLKRLSGRLRISRPVRILQSVLIQTPVVIGHFRPIILMPVRAVTGLSSEQIEAIIAHELAHIRRYDYFISLLQTVIETLLFHHPAVWWISHKIRIEREYCCDDMVVAVTGDRATHARALATIPPQANGAWALTTVAAGGFLVKRIRRLADPTARPSTKALYPAVGLLAAGLLMAAFLGAGLRTPGSWASENDATFSRESSADWDESDPIASPGMPKDTDFDVDAWLAKHLYNPNLPYLVRGFGTRSRTGRQPPLRGTVKAALWRELEKKPDPQLALNLSLILHNQLDSQLHVFVPGKDGDLYTYWWREAEDANFPAIAKALTLGFTHAEKGMAMWKKLGIGLAKLRLAQGDWAGRPMDPLRRVDA